MRAFLIALALLFIPDIAHARREVRLQYPLSRVWTSAVRLMRVDMRCNVTEKDRKDGYMLFDYPQDGRMHASSLEVFEVTEDGRKHVKVILQVQGMPNYVELMLLDKLERKLKTDFGLPKQERADPRPAAPAKEDAKEDQKPQKAKVESADENAKK